MPNNGDSENKERRIRDMLGLVKFCLETTSKEDPGQENATATFEAMDADRRAWLQNAISSMTMDTTKQLLENLAIVKECIAAMERDPKYNVPVQKTCDAIGVLTDLCEDIDYASDFAKLDGFSIFKPLIGCSHEELIVKACELIAALAQNNPACQNMALQTRLLERLVDFVHIKEDQTYIKARSYAFYAISSIIRSNPTVRRHFETHLDGLTVLMHLLNCHPLDKMLDTEKQLAASSNEDNKCSQVYWWRKLRIRSIFLFRTLCSESDLAPKFFHKQQAIKQITSQLVNCPDSEIIEHLLEALKAYLAALSTEEQVESLKLVANLRSVLEDIQNLNFQESTDDYDMTDTKSICKEILDMINSNKAATN